LSGHGEQRQGDQGWNAHQRVSGKPGDTESCVEDPLSKASVSPIAPVCLLFFFINSVALILAEEDAARVLPVPPQRREKPGTRNDITERTSLFVAHAGLPFFLKSAVRRRDSRPCPP
jgi:hypothetical protein